MSENQYDNDNSEREDIVESEDDSLSSRIEALSAAGRNTARRKQKRSVRRREGSEQSIEAEPEGIGGHIKQALGDLVYFTKTQRFRRGSTATLLTVLFIVLLQ